MCLDILMYGAPVLYHLGVTIEQDRIVFTPKGKAKAWYTNNNFINQTGNDWMCEVNEHDELVFKRI